MRTLTALFTAVVLAACSAPEPSLELADSGVTVDTVVEAGGTPVAGEETPAILPTDTVLTAAGWGPLQIGMNRPEIVSLMGDDANPDAVGGPEPEVCDEWQPEGQPGMLLMMEDGRLSRISLIRDSPIRTDRGVRLGDSAASVKSIYGAAAESMPHKYLAAPAEYITYWQTPPPAESPRGIVHEVGLDGTVSHIHGGGPSIQYVEGCL